MTTLCYTLSFPHQVMANPELAAGFQNPKVQAAIIDISANPMNVTKYQNDPEIMTVSAVPGFSSQESKGQNCFEPLCKANKTSVGLCASSIIRWQIDYILGVALI